MMSQRDDENSADETNDSAPELERTLDSRLAEVRAPAGAVLVVVDGSAAGRAFTLDRLDRIIGRSQDSDISLEDASISQRHAKIFVVGGRHTVIDLGSTNGTFLNGEPVRHERTLRNGDVLRIGEAALTYLVPSGDSIEPTMDLRALQDPRVGYGAMESGFVARFPREALIGRGVHELEEGPSFRDFIAKTMAAYRFARHHRGMLGALMVLGLGLGAATTIVMPPAATASFEVRLTPMVASNPVQSFERANLEFFSSAETGFRSPDLVRGTLVALGEPQPPTDRVGAVRKRLKLESAGQMVYRGTFADASPDYALGFLEKHVATYLETEIDKTLQVIVSEVEFLRGQVTQNEAALKRTESELSAFKQKHLDGLPEQARDQFTSLVGLKTRQTALVGELERTRLELDLARSRPKSDEATMDRRVESTQPYRDAMVDVQRKLSEARANGLADEHPEILNLLRQQKELERLNRQTMEADVSDLERAQNRTLKMLRDRVAELQVAKSAAEKELGQVQKQISDVNKVVRELPAVEARYAELNRSYNGTKELHAKLFQQLKASEVQLELERASTAARYQITSPPEVKEASLKKAVALRSGIGAFSGILLALALAGAIELRHYIKRQNL
jgi:pSer/pThr/pTyr-binding forkhead associated (FHA) protein/uncharacterized protein involved in exopolysaccharide biosynthesis